MVLILKMTRLIMDFSWRLFFSVFSFIFIAELPDKTAFAALLLASKGRPVVNFMGVACAFVVQSLVAIAFGHAVSLLPTRWVHLIAGIMFLGLAIHMWMEKHEENNEDQIGDEKENSQIILKKSFWNVFSKAFMVIFIAEWGDITQISTATLAAKYADHKWTVLIAAILALWSVSAIAVALGNKLGKIVSPKKIKLVSTFVFLLVGLYFVFSWV